MINIPLTSAKEGQITLTKLTDPYGANSGDVVSIGVTLNDAQSDAPDWKVHIPVANIAAVIDALKSFQE